MDGPNPADKMFRLKPGNPTPPNAQNNPRGRFPGDNAAPHMDYPLSHNDDVIFISFLILFFDNS